jgi:hypothetical protein
MEAADSSRVLLGLNRLNQKRRKYGKSFNGRQ